MYSPPHSSSLRKGRVSIANQVYLVTITTYQRKPIFQDWQIGRLVVQSMRRRQDSGQVDSLAFVIMPDHLHWLLSLRPGNDLSRVIGTMKNFSSMLIRQRLPSQDNPIWQTGFHDRALRQEQDVHEVARYIVANPLRAGLVSKVQGYPLWDAVWL